MSEPEIPPELRRSWYVEGHIRFEVISSVLMQRCLRTIRQRRRRIKLRRNPAELIFITAEVTFTKPKKVILADGVVVYLKGAKSVSLLRPINLDLPMTKTKIKFASSFLALADCLKHASRTHSQLVALSIMAPTSLTSLKSSVNELKLNRVTSFWPIVSVNGSNTNLISFEKLLTSILGLKVNKEGSFRVLRAEILAKTFVKNRFIVEKLTGDGNE
ncbi:hypothetical protein Tco_0791722 [Tanacetum coccineum]